MSIPVLLFLYTVLLFPDGPRYINDLCDDSDAIIYGHIVDRNIRETENRLFGVAKVIVVENLKGQCSQDTIEVFYRPYILCPRPAELRAGHDALLFLTCESEGYYIYDHQSAAKYFKDRSSYQEYKSRLMKYLHIDEGDKSALVRWVLDNLLYTSTYKDAMGVILSDLENKMMGKSNPFPSGTFPITSYWNEEHKAILRERILKGRMRDASQYPQLLCAAYTAADQDFEKYLINMLKTYNYEERIFGVVEIIKTITPFDNSCELIEIRDTVLDTSTSDTRITELCENYISTYESLLRDK